MSLPVFRASRFLLMQRLHALPIKYQVGLIAFVTVMLCLLVCVACLVVGELEAASQVRQESAERITRLVGRYAAEAVHHNAQAEAVEMLAALGAEGDVIAITIVDTAGREFVHYRSPSPAHAAVLATIAARHSGSMLPDTELDAPRLPLSTLLAQPFLELAQPITHHGRQLGVIEAYFDRAPLADLVARRVQAAAAVLLATALLSWLVVRRLQRIVSVPVERFARHVEEVARTRDYSLRARPVGSDEISTLVRGFNGMLEQLEAGHAQLCRARDAAEEASRAKSLFLATVSHEIRNPMNGVIGMANLLAFTQLTDEQQNLLRHIRLSADGLMRVLNDILDFAKLEAGRMEVDPVWCCPREVVDDVAAFFQFQAAEKGLLIRCDIADELPDSIKADPIRLRQILCNLIANAIKFTPSGDIHVRVTSSVLKDGDGAQALLHFSVRDSGIGIDPKVVPRLFTPFTQADNSYARRFGGTGLGLAICHQLVDLMGGEIGVESEPGQGATFWFTITAPLREAGAEPVKPARHPLDTREDRAELAGLRVLVADDDPVNRVIATAQLEQFHCEVTSVANGVEVLARLAYQPVDILLIDAQMPDLDGYETAHRIRRQEAEGTRVQRLPIIMMSGAVSEQERARLCGMDDFLAKPYSPAALRDVLVRHRPIRAATPRTHSAGNA